VVQETNNLLQAAVNPSVLERPSVVKGIAPFMPTMKEVVVDLEWEYHKAVPAKKATKKNPAVAAQPAKSGGINVVGVCYEVGKSYSTFDVAQGTDTIARVLSEGTRFIGHNIIDADLPKLRELGYAPLSYHPKHIIDTKIIAHLIHPHWSELGLFSLSDLVRYYIPVTQWKEDKNDILYYNGLDTAYNYRLWKALEVDLSITDQWHLVEKDQRLAHMAHLMRTRGMRIDSPGIRQFNTEWAAKRAAFAAGFPFNPNSWQQVEKWFAANGGPNFHGTSYDNLVQKFRAGSTHARDNTRLGPDGSLITLADLDRNRLKPWQVMMYNLIQYKDEGKGLASWFNEEAIERGRIHSRFNVTGTSVARFSSAEPNTQNVPPWARRFILAQSDDEFLASFDGKNIEGRTVARLAHDEQMLADFASGLDIHRITAGRSFNKPAADITGAERQAGKQIVHASNYLETAPSLAGRLYGNVTRDSIIKAEKLQKTYFTAYHGIATWHRNIREAMSRGDITIRNSFGRVRSIYDINDHERAKRACHFLGCSDGADIVNQRALDVWDATGYIPQSIVHDELLYSFPKGDGGERLVREVKDILNSPIKQLDGYVIPFDYKHGTNYGKHSELNPNGFVEEK
jgi:DNA polymerase I-like protein with 3'-5' exonuclease and polymerase domains